MACPAFIIPAGAIAASAGAGYHGLPGKDVRMQAAVSTIGAAACFVAIRIKNGAWRIGGCRNTKMAAGAGVSLIAVCAYKFLTSTTSADQYTSE